MHLIIQAEREYAIPPNIGKLAQFSLRREELAKVCKIIR